MKKLTLIISIAFLMQNIAHAVLLPIFLLGGTGYAIGKAGKSENSQKENISQEVNIQRSNECSKKPFKFVKFGSGSVNSNCVMSAGYDKQDRLFYVSMDGDTHYIECSKECKTEYLNQGRVLKKKCVKKCEEDVKNFFEVIN
tara:strand:+ start:2622 stop:3047 length:426 start_codon:yes stop_codon:yes gene_type:complete